MSVVSAIILYDLIQAELLSNRLNWFGIEYVCDARNWTQHQTMSLPMAGGEASDITQPTEQQILFEAVRHALIIHTLIAVFPLPLSSAPFAELAQKLYLDILAICQAQQDTVPAALLLWISSLAALAAIGTTNRARLVTIVTDLCASLGIKEWEVMKVCLQDYLWSEDISDFDGIYLFIEIQSKMVESDESRRSEPGLRLTGNNTGFSIGLGRLHHLQT